MSDVLDPEVWGYGLAAWMDANARVLSQWMRLTATEINALPQRLGMPVDLSSAVALSMSYEPAEDLAQPGGPMPIDLRPVKVNLKLKAKNEEQKPKGPPASQLDALEL